MTYRANKLELSRILGQKIPPKMHVLYEFTAIFDNVKFK